MDLVDIDKVLDDLELDENNVVQSKQHDESVLVKNPQSDEEVKKTNLDNKKPIKNNTENSASQSSASSLNQNLNNELNSRRTTINNNSSGTAIQTQKNNLNLTSATSGRNSNDENKFKQFNPNDNLQENLSKNTSSSSNSSINSNNVLTNKNFNKSTTSSGSGSNGDRSSSTSSGDRNCCTNKTNGSNNVSQVFNSLDEYRKDVESLRINIDRINLYEIKTTDNDDDDDEDDNNKSEELNKNDEIEDINNSNYRQLQNQNAVDIVNQKITIGSNKSVPEIKLKSNNSTTDSQSYLKFSNHDDLLLAKMIEDDDSVDNLTSTSSITTSSPSSFSSGPSPRSPSSSADCAPDDDINELGEYDEEEGEEEEEEERVDGVQKKLSIPSNNDIIQKKKSTDHHQLLQQIVFCNPSILEHPINTTTTMVHDGTSENISNICDDDDDNLEDSNNDGQNSIDLVGLSSISSSLYIENSLSSIQQPPPELLSSIEQNKNNLKYNNIVERTKCFNNESLKNEINSEASFCENNKLKSGDEEDDEEEEEDEVEISITGDDISTPTQSEVLLKNCDTNDDATNKKYNNNYDQNLGIVNNVKDVNAKDNFLILQNPTIQSNEMNSTHMMNNKNEHPKILTSSADKNYPKKLPITFGSTMDEISDTELDSMLQEIDNELQSNNGIMKDKIFSEIQEAEIKPKNFYSDEIATTSSSLVENNKSYNDINSPPPTSSNNNNAILIKEDSINYHHLQLVQPENSCEISEETKLYNKVIITDDDINLQNADSFSQASTVEFADLQSHNDLRNIDNDAEIICNNDRSSETNEIKSIKLNNFKIACGGGPSNIENNHLEREYERNDVRGVRDIKCENQNLQQQQSVGEYNVVEVDDIEITKEKGGGLLRRPKLLNLPLVAAASTSLSSASSGLSNNYLSSENNRTLNIDGTAGQTPPASVVVANSNLTTNFQSSTVDELQESSSAILPQSQYSITTTNQQTEGDDYDFRNQNEIIDEISSGATIDNNLNEDSHVTSSSVAPSSKSSSKIQNYQLGKIPPFWIPDSEASFCMQCKVKFSLIKRRHHCRACGHVLCSLCCSQRAKLEFLGNENEVRVCVQCHLIINNNMESNHQSSDNNQQLNESAITTSSSSTSDLLGAVGGVTISSSSNITSSNINNTNLVINNLNSTSGGNIRSNNNSVNNTFITRSPNPNNPMEYCSTIPPHEQVKKNQVTNTKPISVMVPVGVLKREGALSKNRKDKNVIFSDGIRPGCDLADLDNSWLDKSGGTNSCSSSPKKNAFDKDYIPPANPRILRKILPVCDENNSYIPREVNALPPIYEKVSKTNEYDYKEIINNSCLIDRLQKECLKFAVQRNFYVYVKIVKLTCCVNKTVINFTTHGMHHVGQDEIIILLEYDNSNLLPKDIFVHLNEIYRDADKGHPITELGYSITKQQNFLCCNTGSNTGSAAASKTSSASTSSSSSSSSSNNGGFLYIRSSFQCLQEIKLPDPPYLIGILIHRFEIPWAKIFPLRLMLRLGAQYRYYPSPHISIRGRKSVYAEIAQTIINFLADFRNYSYTIPIIKGMFIHMEDRKTSVLIPKNRHDQIVKALNNSSDHILALGGNFSKTADGHLVCIQNLESDCPDTHTYSTQAINIQGQPRRVTGASFIVLNGALKTNSGLSGKCSIVEDGLMVHVLSQNMQLIRKNLKNMEDVDIKCGPVDADETQTEMVSIQWVDDDTEFNIGVKSPIDDKILDGISSIRVHSGLNYSNSNFVIRWTEVFLIQSKGNETTIHGKNSIDISKISEQIARNTSTALVPLLDLLAASGCVKIALRVTLHQDNVCYEAGSKNFKLAPLYMNALDNELIPILHKQATMYEINNPIILELIFHILHK